MTQRTRLKRAAIRGIDFYIRPNKEAELVVSKFSLRLLEDVADALLIMDVGGRLQLLTQPR
jgi:hypothetical protein